MAIKDILLHLDDSPNCAARLELAIGLARAHGAHLKGLYVVTHSYYAPRHGAGASETLARIEAMFRDRTGEAGISAEWLYVNWSVVGVSITEILDLHAYYSDLVIVSQPDYSQGSGASVDIPERLGLGAGRPVLVVPYAGTFPVCGERAMIAWRAGRESSRVVNDAMPILERAGHVTVATVGMQGLDNDAVVEDIARISAYLARHRVAAVHEQILTSASIPVGDVLLNHACEQKMDLLVMGAFASTRRGAFVLGPVARHLMTHMTLPVLISH